MFCDESAQSESATSPKDPHRPRPSTLANYADVLKPLRAAHGQMPVQRLEKAHIDALVTSLAGGGLLSPTAAPVAHGRLAR